MNPRVNLLSRADIDLHRNIILAAFDYLHRGDALDSLSLDSFPDETVSRSRLIKNLGTAASENRHLVEVIRGFGDRMYRSVYLPNLRSTLEYSRQLRAHFHAINCRGFSFALRAGFRLLTPLRKELNLRLALVPEKTLFYPPRVRRYLHNRNRAHLFNRGLPAIAFLLGTMTPRGWFVFVIQSDLASNTPAYVRDHFRGWRRVLFSLLIRLAIGRTKSLFLATSNDVCRACSEDSEEAQPSDAWSALYDGTARFFQMKHVTLNQFQDIQTLLKGHPQMTRHFHRLDLTERVKQRFAFIFAPTPHSR